MVHTLSDDTRVRLRCITPADKALLATAMAALSPQSLRQRFLVLKSRLTAEDLRYLTEVDGHDHVAIVGVLDRDPSVLVGVARFVLGETLADDARTRGVRRFTATLLGSNAAAHALFASISRRVQTSYASGVPERLTARSPRSPA